MYRNYVDVSAVKLKLTEAFKILRKEGFIARQNFMCCGNCAGYDIATIVSKMPEKKRAKVKGCVFYHHQDNDRLKETGKVMLAYGPLETSAHGTVGLPDVEVGRRVVEVLKQVGLTVDWNGEGSQRIETFI